MGVENMGPLLYSLVRFLKPTRVVEIGAGFTTVFLLQALADNYAEIEHHWRFLVAGANKCGEADWGVAGEIRRLRENPGVLHCIDNLAHEHTTAHKVQDASTELGLNKFLSLHVQDASEFLSEAQASEQTYDMLWVDVGAGKGMKALFDVCLERLDDRGGYILVHSTLTNTLMRNWLDSERDLKAACGGSGRGFELHSLSFLEPHKRFQNSVTLFQKRGNGFAEPIHSQYP
eukprot:c4722_g1_i1.p2 GENE.c4722_g1_i1~~c4722_g1_i1.p2  ORF type:complete len:231 (+),score=53.93 c4722_g1_i1:691-1383(+)